MIEKPTNVRMKMMKIKMKTLHYIITEDIIQHDTFEDMGGIEAM